MKETANNAFYQLLGVYSILILLSSIGVFWKYSLQLHLFAIVISFVGFFAISRGKETKESSGKRYYILLMIAIGLIFGLRMLSYLHNDVPLGYDAGIYKYAIEDGLENMDQWIITGPTMEPGFLYFMELFKPFFSTEFILTWLLIGFCILLGYGVYLLTKEYFDKKTAVISIVLFSFSLIQFKTFWYMYYRNILGLCLMVFAIYFLKKVEINKKLIWLFVLFGGFLGAVHRPTFYIFGLSYFVYAITSPYKEKNYDFAILKENVFYGALIIILAGLFYLGEFKDAILMMFEPILQGFLQPGESAGTFINFFTYQYSILPYLPLALLGLFYFIKKKDFNMLALWAILNLAVVYFQFFFFNRLIIMLDVVLIILASKGFSIILEDKKKIGAVIMALLLLSAGIFAFKEASNSKPLIESEELKIIESLNNTEEDAFIMVTSSYYSPWAQGYSGRKVIAPGLFDYNKWDYTQWNTFWTASPEEASILLQDYAKPLYIFVGKYQRQNLEQYNHSCFIETINQSNTHVFKVVC